jgi:tellurite resistance protein TerC
VWFWTLGSLSLVLLVDFILAFRNRNQLTTLRAATMWTIFYVSLAIAFGIGLGSWATHQAQREFFAGWLTEYSLSFDNLFVFILIMAKMKVSKEREEIVLFGGIVVSLFLRGICIAGGSALINRFAWTFFILGGFLIYTAVRLFMESEEEEWQEGRWIVFLKSKGASTAVVALAALSVTNVLFALDSIPAIFGLTKDTYIVVTANIFALMGLRQLYFLIGGLMTKLVFLTEGLSAILGFIGIKLIFEAMVGEGWHKVAGIKVPEIGLGVSLGFIIFTLIITASLSLWSTREKEISHDNS